jgi:hypothetical protein
MLYTPIRNTAKSKYSHNRVKGSQKGGFTLAWREMGNNLVYAVSICSDKDMFNKQNGRELCDARLDAVSLSEEGGIQQPLNIEKYITVVDLASTRKFLVESKFYLNMFTLKKAIDLANSIEFSHLSDRFILDLYFSVALED